MTYPGAVEGIPDVIETSGVVNIRGHRSVRRISGVQSSEFIAQFTPTKKIRFDDDDLRGGTRIFVEVSFKMAFCAVLHEVRQRYMAPEILSVEGWISRGHIIAVIA